MLIKYPEINGAIFEPTYGDIRDIIVPALDSFCDEYGILHSWNKKDNIYTLPFGKIMLRSMHDPKSIVGFEVGWAFVDEIDTLSVEKARLAWEKIIARARIPLPDGAPNVVGAATTPEGFGFCYNRWVKNSAEGYKRVHGKTISALKAGFISTTYVQNLKESYTEELQKAYLEGQFVNLTSSCFYYGFSEENIKEVSIDRALPINLCFDFNVDPAVACIAQDKGPNDIRAVDSVYIRNSNTREVCEAIKEKLSDFRSMDVVVYGDASGFARDTRSNISDYIIIEEELKPFFRNFRFDVGRSNPSIRDRENAVNNYLQKKYIWVDPKNEALIEDFRQIVRKGDDMDKSNSMLTHISDAFGYFVHKKYPIQRKVPYRKPFAL